MPNRRSRSWRGPSLVVQGFLGPFRPEPKIPLPLCVERVYKVGSDLALHFVVHLPPNDEVALGKIPRKEIRKGVERIITKALEDEEQHAKGRIGLEIVRLRHCRPEEEDKRNEQIRRLEQEKRELEATLRH